MVIAPPLLLHSTKPAVRKPRTSEWRGRRVTLMGLGRHGGGLGAARYLALAGARLTISDVATRESLGESLAALSGHDVTLRLGGHDPRDFQTAEFVVVNPAVRPDHPCLQLARESGAVLTSEIELFLNRCPAKVIAVTGSNGKSTTSAMLAAILEESGRRTWLGGNIGGSLLGELPHMSGEDWVVIELSSFQLAHLSAGARRGEIAVITNCSPNHLDWHGSFAAYVAAKQRLVARYGASPLVVLNRHDSLTAGWARMVGRRVTYGWPLEAVGTLAVPGEHNRQNAACAAAAAQAAGVVRATILAALRRFTGLDHRLQLVAEIAGRRFYNDSKSTAPAATLAALNAVDGPVWLLLGGQSKGADFGALAEAVVSRARGAAMFGASRHELAERLATERADFSAHQCERMSNALQWCWRHSREGDAIVLSPACASHDQYRDFAARGDEFSALVRTAGAIMREQTLATPVRLR